MKLASYVVGGKPAFGVVTDDNVITMSGRLLSGAATLRDALAAGALEEIRDLAKSAQPDSYSND